MNLLRSTAKILKNMLQNLKLRSVFIFVDNRLLLVFKNIIGKKMLISYLRIPNIT